MLKLLNNSPPSDYPDEYLYSRVRGRGADLITDLQPYMGKTELPCGDDPWNYHKGRDERHFLFSQMNLPLRKKLAPVFLFFELENIILFIRYRESDSAAPLDDIIQAGLLAPPFQKSLQSSKGIDELLSCLESFFFHINNQSFDLVKVYKSHGIGTCEAAIRKQFLAESLRSHLHPEVRLFFQDIIDFRNMLLAAKSLRWQNSFSVDFPDGGHIPSKRLFKALSQKNLPVLINHYLSTANKLTDGDIHPCRLEKVLLSELLRKLHRRSRQYSIVATLIYHIFRTEIETRNIRLLFYNREKDVNSLAGEVIQ